MQTAVTYRDVERLAGSSWTDEQHRLLVHDKQPHQMSVADCVLSGHNNLIELSILRRRALTRETTVMGVMLKADEPKVILSTTRLQNTLPFSLTYTTQTHNSGLDS